MTNYTILVDNNQKRLLAKMLCKFSEMALGQTKAEREECKRLEQQLDKLHPTDVNDFTKSSKL
jgi:hypothetical protein